MNGCFQANILAVIAVRLRFLNSGTISGPWQVVWILLLSDADLSTRALTPPECIARIRSLSGLDRR